MFSITKQLTMNEIVVEFYYNKLLVRDENVVYFNSERKSQQI